MTYPAWLLPPAPALKGEPRTIILNPEPVFGEWSAETRAHAVELAEAGASVYEITCATGFSPGRLRKELGDLLPPPRPNNRGRRIKVADRVYPSVTTARRELHVKDSTLKRWIAEGRASIL